MSRPVNHDEWSPVLFGSVVNCLRRTEKIRSQTVDILPLLLCRKNFHTPKLFPYVHLVNRVRGLKSFIYKKIKSSIVIIINLIHYHILIVL